MIREAGESDWGAGLWGWVRSKRIDTHFCIGGYRMVNVGNDRDNNNDEGLCGLPPVPPACTLRGGKGKSDIPKLRSPRSKKATGSGKVKTDFCRERF